MVMVSSEILMDYHDRADKLNSSFRDNLDRAKAKMVVEDSPVDYETFKFICSIYRCIHASHMKSLKFVIYTIDTSNYIERIKNIIEEFHELEEELDSQNELLDKLVSKQTMQATS